MSPPLAARRDTAIDTISVLSPKDDDERSIAAITRRSLMASAMMMFTVAGPAIVTVTEPAYAENEPAEPAKGGGGDDMFAPKFVQQYGDFIQSREGWSYRDVSEGSSSSSSQEAAQKGTRVVFEWSGYTIGYFGRPFQAKGGPKGGAFDTDLDYSRTVIGSGDLVAGLESALVGMRPGGVRQVVVPYGPLSYPADDPDHDRVGPKPTTFSGQRALNFVLENPRIDRTLLFNVKVIRVDRPNGKGGFVRG